VKFAIVRDYSLTALLKLLDGGPVAGSIADELATPRVIGPIVVFSLHCEVAEALKILSAIHRHCTIDFCHADCVSGRMQSIAVS